MVSSLVMHFNLRRILLMGVCHSRSLRTAFRIDLFQNVTRFYSKGKLGRCMVRSLHIREKILMIRKMVKGNHPSAISANYAQTKATKCLFLSKKTYQTHNIKTLIVGKRVLNKLNGR